MPTAFSDQEKLVPVILSLFGDSADELTAVGRQDLGTAVDLAVHFYFYLRERASDPLVISDDEIEDVLLDLTANASSLWHLRVGTNVFLERERRSLGSKWEQFSDLESLKRSYFASYEKLVSESTPLKERYLHLLRLAKIQLMFAGLVFS